MQGYRPTHEEMLVLGREAHRHHGRLVWRALWLRGVGWALLLLAALMLAVGLALRVSGG